MFSRVRNLIQPQFYVHRLRRLDASAQQRDQAVLLFNRLQQLAQLLRVRKIRRRSDLRRAIHINFPVGHVAQNARVAQNQRRARQLPVLLAVLLQLFPQIRAHRLQSPANVMPIQILRGAIQLFLLDRTSEYLNRHYIGWTLEAMRADLRKQLEQDREQYGQLAGTALILCDPSILGDVADRKIYVDGAAQIASSPDFTNPEQLRELLEAIEEKDRLIALLSGCIEAPEP